MEKTTKEKSRVKYFVLMHCVLLFLSLNAVFSKMAAQHEWLSLKWIILYGLVLFCLGVYAIAWQIILKGLPLTVAFSNKAVNIAWGMFWGAVIFKESITPKMIIAAAIIFAGIIVISTEKEQASELEAESEVTDNE